jgi:TonB-dependent starch-binding outer membrane protein SusC
MINFKSIKQKKRITLLLIASFSVVLTTWSQNKITGLVKDSSGELPGVSVSVEGNQSIGTITDNRGEFSISVPTTAKKLVFKFIGKETKVVSITGQKEILVQLDDQSVNLNEVVAVGYGTIRKRDLTGAVSVISQNDFKNVKALSVVDAMQGLASGVNIRNTGALGSEPTIEIRGIGNFTNSAPLYVIDGLVTTGGIRDLNVNDVESIQVLKDASAAAIYGNRAANGVVIVTTKKGKKGEMKVEFSVKYSIDKTPRMNLMDTTRFIKFNDMAYRNAGLSTQNHYTANTDWQKETFQTGITKDYNIGVSGGTDKTNYLVSMNYYDNVGTTKGSELTRYSFRVNTESKRGIFTIGENLAITDNKVTSASSGNPYIDAARMTPDIAVKDSLHPGGYGYGDEARARTFGGNPIAMQNLINNTSGNTRIRGNAYLNIQLAGFLTYKMNAGYETSFDNASSLRKAGSWTLNQPLDPSSLYNSRNRYESKLFENTLNFNKDFGKHRVDAVLGISYQNETSNMIWGNVQNVVQVNGNYFDVLDAGQSNSTTGGWRDESKLISYLGRVNYNYDNRYLFSGTFRNDATSKFSKSNRSGFFPSISAGWRVSNEKFFNVDWISDLKLRANYGSLGNAAIGNYTYVPTLSHFPLAVFGTTQQVYNGMTQLQLANEDLHWETKTQKNIGLDIAFLKNRLQVSAEYFISTTKDVLVPAPILMATGNDGGNPLANAASLENKGVELTALWKDQIGDFKYSVSANITKINNKVLTLGYGKQEVLTGLTITEVGQPIGMFYLIKTNGIFKTQEELDSYVTSKGVPIVNSNNKRPELGDIRYVDFNDDGIISSAGDRQNCGSPWPTFEGGISFNVEYKHFDLSVIGFGSFGQKGWNQLSATLNRFDDNSNYLVGINPWTPENTNTNFPRLLYGDDRNSRGDQDRWLEDASYFKIKDITLGYSFKMPVIAKYVDNLRVSVTAQNFITFTKYTGLDPEFVNGSIYDRGVDPVSYPSPKSFMFSLNVTF